MWKTVNLVQKALVEMLQSEQDLGMNSMHLRYKPNDQVNNCFNAERDGSIAADTIRPTIVDFRNKTDAFGTKKKTELPATAPVCKSFRKTNFSSRLLLRQLLELFSPD